MKALLPAPQCLAVLCVPPSKLLLDTQHSQGISANAAVCMNNLGQKPGRQKVDNNTASFNANFDI